MGRPLRDCRKATELVPPHLHESGPSSTVPWGPAAAFRTHHSRAANDPLPSGLPGVAASLQRECPMDISTACQVICERHRQRQDLRRAEKNLTQQARAICKRLVGGNKGEAAVLYAAVAGKISHPKALVAAAIVQPLQDARATIRFHRIAVEKLMEADAKKLPIWPRVKATPGFGPLNLACLIGETGDLTNYATHSKTLEATWIGCNQWRATTACSGRSRHRAWLQPISAVCHVERGAMPLQSTVKKGGQKHRSYPQTGRPLPVRLRHSEGVGTRSG